MHKVEPPLVSIVVPVRNEVDHIQMCLDAILAQNYPGQMEVLVVDGLSDDGTQRILLDYTSNYSNIQVLENTARIVPTAMNIGIRNAHGEIIIRVDGRCFVEPDYVSQCVNHLQETKAWNVGGRQQAEEQDDIVSEAIALATTSPFGIGGSQFHYSDKAQYVDTVYLGAYPRWVFDKVGLYDESLVRNQDYELNHRVCKAGGRIYFTPDIRSVYYGRSSLSKLRRQYFQYGFWKMRVLKKHPDSLKWRHLVAPLFVASLVISSLFSWLWIGRLALLAIIFSYAMASTVASISALSDAEDRRSVLLLPVVFAILHLSWGLGFWWSLLNILRHPSKVPWSGATDR